MTSPEPELDPAAAAALIQQTTHQAERALSIRQPVLYAAWGVAWLVGQGAMWLSVRGQTPYRGPATVAGIVLGVLIVLAMVVTMVTVIRATRGISGRSELQGRIVGWSWLVGFGLFFALVGALARAGAGPTVLGVAGAAGPMLVTALNYLAQSAVWVDWYMFGMGLWLAVVTMVGMFTGPVTVLLFGAIGGGGGFLAMAGYLAWIRRR